ncbi:MAG: 3-isopropylmalate dehydratase large subunit [Candidatus Bathyarchaeia archaeon]
MTITEKILNKTFAGKKRKHISPGEFVIAKVDLACVDDIQFQIFLKKFLEMNPKQVWDVQKCVLVNDHSLPPSDVDSAEIVRSMKEFKRKYGVNHVFLNEGIKHQVLLDYGLIKPGMIVVATDSHINTLGALGAFATSLGPTEIAYVFIEGEIWFRVPETIEVEITGKFQRMVTAKDLGLELLRIIGNTKALYKAIEFKGPLIRKLSLDGRLTLCNLTTEMGAKNGIIEPDKKVISYLSSWYPKGALWLLKSDANAEYHETFTVNVNELEPQISLPHNPLNVKSVTEAEGIEIDQAFIGTCTGGNLEDLAIAAKILKGKKVHPNVRLIIIPASRMILLKTLQMGLIEIFIDAGGIVCNPNCGPCAGIHQGVLASNEVMISTQNRNFRGRSGSYNSKIYLASAATVAASAIEGKITDPRRYK